MKISPYWKSVIAALGVVVTTVVAAVENGNIDSTEGGFIATSVLVLIGVFFKRNQIAGVKVSEEERKDIGP